MSTQVRNINGTSDANCKCTSWLDHWKKFSGQTATYCSEVSCKETELVGAHVQRSDTNDQSWYIVPLCQSHNKKASTLSIMDSRVLVSANKKLTCEKS